MPGFTNDPITYWLKTATIIQLAPESVIWRGLSRKDSLLLQGASLLRFAWGLLFLFVVHEMLGFPHSVEAGS